ncbi:Endo-1,4-beta-xylanase 4 [Sesamum alatum]|uniref:Endo-1,4-beta-xylanase 4 n=1 Tax=Sesamum alatum TaxID=300844 RepID=A0AAE1YJ00_9LAMI|nr:Endo-1,4-beta-xylanase 4 [Sesamum alatum]
MKRYKGQFIHWDIVNENMHHGFLEEILGTNASSVYYRKANEIDPKTMPFLNEYFTIEKSQDQKASPWKYLQKIWEIRRQGYKGPLGIGLQGHFSELNLPYLRASIDVLNSAKLPMWITELDVSNKTWPNQAKYLEQILRELHAHEAVQGIIIWGGWWPNQGCWRMCLTDDNFKNLATGDVVDKIMAEWTYAGGFKATTDARGRFQTSLFHGQYEAQITHSKLAKLNSNLKKFEVFPNGRKAQNIVLN